MLVATPQPRHSSSAMKLKQALAKLEAASNEKVFERNAKNGAKDQYGVPLGEIRKIAKAIKSNHELGLELWETGNLDARMLAILLIKPKELSVTELKKWVRSAKIEWLADWLNSYVVKKHPEKDALREAFMKAKDPWHARSGWSLTTERIEKDPDGLDIDGLLDRLESEMAGAKPPTQWTMNFGLIAIGTHHPKQRKRAIEIGERLGLYRDYPTPKGCTSPFAPLAIPAMVRRKK